MKCIYRLEHVKFYYHDHNDDEDVEERLVLGHFSSHDALQKAINDSVNYGLPQNELKVTQYFDTFANNQKYVYVLSHQYYLLNGENYTDYEYIFQPFSNRKKCIELKERLKQNPKFATIENRHYDIAPPDGFCISKDKINHLYLVPNRL